MVSAGAKSFSSLSAVTDSRVVCGVWMKREVRGVGLRRMGSSWAEISL